MSEQAKRPAGEAKLPYERPRLEPSELFGVEAGTGSCCRSSPGSCSNATRNAERSSIDPNKIRVSTTS